MGDYDDLLARMLDNQTAANEKEQRAREAEQVRVEENENRDIESTEIWDRVVGDFLKHISDVERAVIPRGMTLDQTYNPPPYAHEVVKCSSVIVRANNRTLGSFDVFLYLFTGKAELVARDYLGSKIYEDSMEIDALGSDEIKIHLARIIDKLV